MNCEFCKNNFKSVSSLNKHQKTAKYCLKIQHKINNIELKKSYEKKIEEITSSYEKRIALLEGNMKAQEESYEKKIRDLQDRIQELAMASIKRPTNTTNTTNTTNNVLNMTPFNIEDKSIKDKIDTLYNLDYLKRGQKGVAEFTKDNILLDDEGKLMYICCDPSRLVFRYKDEKGEVRRDVKANRLSTEITPKILKKLVI